MADREINYFGLKYCALCFEPLFDDFDGTCPVCGQKTTGINFSERLKRDSTVDEKDKSAPKTAVILIAFGFTLQLLYGIIAICWLSGAIKTSTKTFAEYVASHEPTEQELKLKREYEEALKFEDVFEYVRSKSPNGQEEIKYYHSIWNNAWTMKTIAERHGEKTPVDPLPNAKDDTVSENGRTLFDIRGVIGIIVSAIFILLSLCGLAICALTLGRADNSVMYLIWFAHSMSQLVVITLNFISVFALLSGSLMLIHLHERVGGGKLSYSLLWKIHKAKNPIGNADEWCCKNCGYINSKLDSECKSCGKYK